MLPAHLETDSSKLRPFNIIKVVPEQLPICVHLKTASPVIIQWEYRKSATHYIIRSAYSKKAHDVVLDIHPKKFAAKYARWVHGEHIQAVFSEYDAGLREFIKTGITPDEWQEMFAGDEKHDD